MFVPEQDVYMIQMKV